MNILSWGGDVCNQYQNIMFGIEWRISVLKVGNRIFRKKCQIDVIVQGAIVDIAIGVAVTLAPPSAPLLLSGAALNTASIASTAISLAGCIEKCGDEKESTIK